MQYMSEFCIAAVVGTVVLFALYFLKRNYDTPHNRLFFCMVVINLVCSSLNIVSIHSIAHPEQFSAFMRDAVNLTYLWFYCAEGKIGRLCLGTAQAVEQR